MKDSKKIPQNTQKVKHFYGIVFFIVSKNVLQKKTMDTLQNVYNCSSRTGISEDLTASAVDFSSFRVAAWEQ